MNELDTFKLNKLRRFEQLDKEKVARGTLGCMLVWYKAMCHGVWLTEGKETWHTSVPSHMIL